MCARSGSNPLLVTWVVIAVAAGCAGSEGAAAPSPAARGEGGSAGGVPNPSDPARDPAPPRGAVGGPSADGGPELGDGPAPRDAAPDDGPKPPSGSGSGGGPGSPPDAADAGVDQAPGALEAGEPCEGPDGVLGGCLPNLLCCKPCCDGSPAVCTPPMQNDAGIGVGQCPLPDLTVSLSALEQNLGSGPMTFAPQSCEAREMCVPEPGTRHTLHFEVSTPNVGTADLVLGDPEDLPGFEFAPCHDHHHFSGYALYQLLDETGQEVRKGGKQAFCLMDSDPLQGFPLSRRGRPRYDCDDQGISRGWSDSYSNGLDCQFMDVTDVPPGRYILRVTVNPDLVFTELRYDNNVAEVPVELGRSDLGPTEPCRGQVRGIRRECGWQRSMTGRCTPGSAVTVGCGSECGLGERTGDPMIRVCPGDVACAAPGLGSNNDCGNRRAITGARVTFTCPAGGQYTVLTGPSRSDRPATCTLATR